MKIERKTIKTKPDRVRRRRKEQGNMKKWVMLAERQRQEIIDRELDRLTGYSKNLMLMLALFAAAGMMLVAGMSIFAR